MPLCYKQIKREFLKYRYLKFKSTYFTPVNATQKLSDYIYKIFQFNDFIKTCKTYFFRYMRHFWGFHL